MKKSLAIAISLVVLGFTPLVASFRPAGGAGKTVIRDDQTTTAVIEKVIRDNIGWALTKDRPLAESTMVHDESLFIFNPTSESTIGWSRLVKNFDFWMDPRFKATTCEIWDMRIGVSRSGDVAWWSCMLNDLAEWDGKPTGWKDTRWTGVLEKRDGKWLIVQMHFSFAADKIAAQVRAELAAGAAMPVDAGIGLPVLFYSGRNDNKDVYILHPGEKEPRNLTNHPAQDLCPAASPDGKRILFLSDRGGNMDIYSMASDGSDVRRLTVSPETEEHPEFTPDGMRILFVRDLDKRTEIWIMNADGADPRRLTNNDARDERPFLSPDGTRILFMSNRDGNYEIYTMAADGSRQTRLTNTPEWEIFPTWSPDGTKIAYAQKFRAEGRMQGMIRVMNADGSADYAVTAVETRDENPMWSPDGRRIILQSVRDGNFEIYQVDLDGGRPVRLTDNPAWDGWACYLPVKKP